MSDLKPQERQAYEDSMNRRCALCGYPVRKHVVPAYGTPSSEAGPTGMWCPTDARLAALTREQINE
jgi:hypothetical protein